MSVVEAMMMGLVPVVTPVGEIARYCNNKNSIMVYSNMETIRDIILVLKNNNNFSQMSNYAVKTWSGKINYRDSVIQNCNRIINSPKMKKALHYFSTYSLMQVLIIFFFIQHAFLISSI